MAEQLQPSFGKCAECGLHHPPLPLNQKCPMSKPKDSGGKEIQTNEFIVQLKNIVISQVQKKQIKDHKKLFSHVLIELTKYLEAYKE